MISFPGFLSSSALFALHPSIAFTSHELNIQSARLSLPRSGISSSTTSLRNSWDFHFRVVEQLLNR